MTMRIKTKANLLAVLIGIMSLAAVSSAQVGPEIRFVPEAGGLTAIGPASGQYFRMRITGQNAGRLRTKKKYWFRADGVRFEFFSEENSRFLMTDLPRRLDDRVVLELYKSAFLRRNGSPKIRSSWVKLASGRTALFWSYEKFAATPGPPTAAERETFLILAGPGHVYGLFAPVPPGGSERETRRILTRTLGTLTFSDSES
jgi:hypothetical protein